MATNPKSVMVIYGHDYEANSALFDWLRAIGLQPQEWSQLVQLGGGASPYIGQILEQAFAHVQAVIALFTPDEHVCARCIAPASSNSWRFQARPNVLIEAGMALVTHPERTVLVTTGHQELPSDLAGRHYIQLDRTSAPLHEIATRLHAAGCETDTSGTDWLDPTRFPDSAVVNLTNASTGDSALSDANGNPANEARPAMQTIDAQLTVALEILGKAGDMCDRLTDSCQETARVAREMFCEAEDVVDAAVAAFADAATAIKDCDGTAKQAPLMQAQIRKATAAVAKAQEKVAQAIGGAKVATAALKGSEKDMADTSSTTH